MSGTTAPQTAAPRRNGGDLAVETLEKFAAVQAMTNAPAPLRRAAARPTAKAAKPAKRSR